jgi:hypothetical protein
MKAAQDGSLTARQAASIPPDLREAFNHPIRRQIVRTLQEQQGKMTGSDLAHASVVSASHSSVQYHALVLLSRGVLAADGIFPKWFACTSIARISRITAVLRDTQEQDRALLIGRVEAKGRH